LLSAGLFSLLFILFPPMDRRAADHYDPTSSPPPTYTSQAVSPDNALPQTQPSGSPTAPHTADLSLSTPNNADNDAIKQETGLDAAVLGHTYSGSLKMGGFDIMLPPGRWIMLAQMKMNGPKAAGNAYILGRILHKRLVGEIVVHAVKAKPDQQMGPLRDMSKLKFLYKEDECNAEHPAACWVIYGLFTSKWAQWGDHNLKMDNLTRAAVGTMAAKGISYPQDMIFVQFMRGEPWGFLEALYGFNPETANISTAEAASVADTDWAPVNIHRYPEKMAYVEKLRQWGASTWPNFKKAFQAGK
jgi:hypothetical protein